MASTYLSRTISSAGSGTTFTISCWFKRSQVSTDQYLFSSRDTGVSGSSVDQIFISNTDSLIIEGYNGSAYTYRKVLNRKFRDTSAWYHLVIAFDTSNSTADDRIKIYINGVRETSFSTSTNPSSSFNTYWLDTTDPFVVGSDVRSLGSTCFNGLISHLHFSDGYALAPTVFGETDSTTGEWKIKTSPSFTLGTNGFTILKDGNTITDQSANSNNFTLGAGTLTKTEDCPSNVFATWNPLAAHSSNVPFFTNGNTTVRGLDTSSQTVSSTLAMPSKGKWYCEMKLTQEANATSSIPNFGIIDAASLHKFRNQELISYNGGVNSYGGRVNSTNLYVDGSSSGTLSSAPDVGDFMGLAVDLDSSPNTIKYYLNGSLAGTQNINNDEYVFACSIKRDNADGQVDVNFGNGYFGTTAVSSAGTNASGNGIFEYNVPTGYTALSTKGLNL